MSKSLIALLSFILGGGIATIIVSCLFMEKESEKDEGDTKKSNN